MNKLYEEITNAIIEQLEKGVIPWKKPWTGTGDVISHETGKPYSLLNQLLKRPGEYITFLQCQKEGGRVKKGEKASHVYFWKMMVKPVLDEDGQPMLNADGKPAMKSIPVLKCFSVFHIDQCEGIEAKWTKPVESPAVPDEAAEKVLRDYVSREGITLECEETSDRAFYRPSADLIHIPCIGQYSSTAEYYSTAFHEAIHSTGHQKRLNRFSSDKVAAFGSCDYSKEELVAEIGAACLVHSQGLETPASFQNSAAYIDNWLGALKNDKQMVIGAASRAEKAVKMILNEKD